MKSRPLLATLATVTIAAYLASPFLTAWSIREAARNGNSEYLARAINWPTLRASLKPSLKQIALNIPEDDKSIEIKPTLWQRIKSYWGQSAIDSAVDGYLTPENLPKLFTARKAYRDYVKGEDDSKRAWSDRVRRFWSRVQRAAFTSPTTFEIDMLDKHDPNRLYLGKLELTWRGWILQELRIRDLDQQSPASQAAPLMARMPSP